MTVISLEELAFSNFARELVGAEHDVGVCLIFVDAQPGQGPSLHRHPYAEVFIMLEGTAEFTLGDERRTVGPGDIVIAQPGVPHAFTNSGDGPLRQVDIHLSATFSTEWL